MSSFYFERQFRIVAKCNIVAMNCEDLHQCELESKSVIFKEAVHKLRRQFKKEGCVGGMLNYKNIVFFIIFYERLSTLGGGGVSQILTT